MGESIVRMANVRQAAIVQQNLLQDERRYRLAQFRAGFHYPQAQRNDLRSQQEGNHFLLVGFHQRSDHPERGQPQILERTRLGRGVQERIQEQRNMGRQENGSGLRMGRHTLQQGQRVTDPVRLVSRQSGRIDRRIDVDDFLQQCRRGSKTVPQHRGQIRHRFALFAQLQQGGFTRFRIRQLVDPLEDFLAIGRRLQTGGALLGGHRCGSQLERIPNRTLCNQQ